MDNDTLHDKWNRMKAMVKAEWHKLTDDDLDHISGKRDLLAGRIAERHGLPREAAETQINEFSRKNPDFPFEKS